jgi:hypothetical protein
VTGASELEWSYGVGLRPGAAECGAFLAGAPRFSIDALEVWQIITQ